MIEVEAAAVPGGVAGDAASGNGGSPFARGAAHADAAAVAVGRRVAFDGAVRDHERPLRPDAAAVVLGFVVRYLAARDGQLAHVVDAASVVSGRVVLYGAVDNDQCGVGAIVADAAASVTGIVADLDLADVRVAGCVGRGGRRAVAVVLVEDAATVSCVARDLATSHREGTEVRDAAAVFGIVARDGAALDGERAAVVDAAAVGRGAAPDGSGIGAGAVLDGKRASPCDLNGVAVLVPRRPVAVECPAVEVERDVPAVLHQDSVAVAGRILHVAGEGDLRAVARQAHRALEHLPGSIRAIVELAVDEAWRHAGIEDDRGADVVLGVVAQVGYEAVRDDGVVVAVVPGAGKLHVQLRAELQVVSEVDDRPAGEVDVVDAAILRVVEHPGVSGHVQGCRARDVYAAAVASRRVV